MRSLLLLIPLTLYGCSGGRQGAVTSDGRVASTVEKGTYISGRGKVADGGNDVAWSPDGQTLAIAADDGVIFWPKGDPIKGIGRPLAWSPFGDQIAGASGSEVKVKNILTGESRTAVFATPPTDLRWTADGKLLGVSQKQIQLDDGAILDRKDSMIFDAVPAADGTVTWLEGDKANQKHFAQILNLPLRLGHWNPVNGAVTASTLPDVAHLFGTPSPRKFFFPVTIVLAPGGTRFAAAAYQFESGARAVTRLQTLVDLGDQRTKVENTELDTIVKAARVTSIVIGADANGHGDTLWTSLLEQNQFDPTDLSWSPDGKWLAIANKDGTVRVATQ